MVTLAHAVPPDSSRAVRRPVVTSEDRISGARSAHQRAAPSVTLRMGTADDVVTHDRDDTLIGCRPCVELVSFRAPVKADRPQLAANTPEVPHVHAIILGSRH